MVTGATSGFPFSLLDVGAIASGVVRVSGVDVKTQGGAWKRLEHTTFEDRTAYGGGHPASIGEPRVWAEFQTDKLAILPPPDRGYEFVVWYLPVLNDLSADTDQFDGVCVSDKAVLPRAHFIEVNLRVVAASPVQQQLHLGLVSRGSAPPRKAG